MTADPTPTPEQPRIHRPGDGCGELLWEHMSADPSFDEEMRQAEAELAEGRGTPFREVARPEQDEAVRLAAKIDQTDRIRNAYRGSTLGFSEWLDHEMELLQGSASFLATPPPVPAAPPLDVERLREALQLNGYWLGSMLSDVARDYARLSPVQEEAM